MLRTGLLPEIATEKRRKNSKKKGFYFKYKLEGRQNDLWTAGFLRHFEVGKGENMGV